MTVVGTFGEPGAGTGPASGAAAPVGAGTSVQEAASFGGTTAGDHSDATSSVFTDAHDVELQTPAADSAGPLMNKQRALAREGARRAREALERGETIGPDDAARFYIRPSTLETVATRMRADGWQVRFFRGSDTEPRGYRVVAPPRGGNASKPTVRRAASAAPAQRERAELEPSPRPVPVAAQASTAASRLGLPFEPPEFGAMLQVTLLSFDRTDGTFRIGVTSEDGQRSWLCELVAAQHDRPAGSD